MAAVPAVVAPLREEVAVIRGRLRGRARVPTAAGRFTAGELAGRRVVVGWTGDGRRAAREGLTALLATCEVEPLVVVGVAGALVPELALGEVVVGREVRDEDGPAPTPDEAWTRRAAALPRTQAGVLVTARRILATAAAKRALGERLAVEDGLAGVALTVDLETAIYARVAAARGVRWVALRAVSDLADEDLPLDFGLFCDADGRTRRYAVALHALTHPALVPELRGLARRVGLCAERLDRAVTDLLDASP